MSACCRCCSCAHQPEHDSVYQRLAQLDGLLERALVDTPSHFDSYLRLLSARELLGLIRAQVLR